MKLKLKLVNRKVLLIFLNNSLYIFSRIILLQFIILKFFIPKIDCIHFINDLLIALEFFYESLDVSPYLLDQNLIWKNQS